MRELLIPSIYLKRKYKKEFEEIINLTSSLGGDVISGHVLEITPTELEEKDTRELKTRYEALIKTMKMCDAVIFEGTVPSTGCGHFLTIALQNHIPVLFLNQNRYTGLMIRDANRILKVKMYDPKDLKDLEQTIKKFIQFANGKKLRTRFNIMIDDSIENHLNYISKTRNMSKADYVRSLIYKDVEDSIIE